MAVKFQHVNDEAKDLRMFDMTAVDSRMYQSYCGDIQLLSSRTEAGQSGGDKQGSNLNQPVDRHAGGHHIDVLLRLPEGLGGLNVLSLSVKVDACCPAL